MKCPPFFFQQAKRCSGPSFVLHTHSQTSPPQLVPFLSHTQSKNRWREVPWHKSKKWRSLHHLPFQKHWASDEKLQRLNVKGLYSLFLILLVFSPCQWVTQHRRQDILCNFLTAIPERRENIALYSTPSNIPELQKLPSACMIYTLGIHPTQNNGFGAKVPRELALVLASWNTECPM